MQKHIEKLKIKRRSLVSEYRQLEDVKKNLFRDTRTGATKEVRSSSQEGLKIAERKLRECRLELERNDRELRIEGDKSHWADEWQKREDKKLEAQKKQRLKEQQSDIHNKPPKEDKLDQQKVPTKEPDQERKKGADKVAGAKEYLAERLASWKNTPSSSPQNSKKKSRDRDHEWEPE